MLGKPEVTGIASGGKRHAETGVQLAVAARFTRVLRAFIMLSVLVIISLIAFFAIYSARSTDRAVADTEKLSRTLTALVEDQVLRSLQNVQLILGAVRDNIVDGDANPFASVADVLRGNPLVRGLTIADMGGRVTASSHAEGDIGRSIAERDFYDRVKNAKSPLAIGAPFKGRSFSDLAHEGPNFIPVALRVSGKNGEFLGVVIAALNPEVFRLQYQTIADNNHAVVSLIRYDGVLLVGGGKDTQEGANVSADNIIFQRFLPEREAGTFLLPASRTREALIVSFSVTRLWPVIVSVGINRKTALAAPLEDTLATGVVTLVTMLLIGGSAALMAQQLVTLRRQSALLSRREEDATAARYQLELAINSISDGFCYFDAEDRLAVANATYRSIYTEREDIFTPGRTFEQICRAMVADGRIQEAIGREEEWIRKRLRVHANPGEPFEQQLSNGRWLRILERRTPDGGRVGLRTDITELKTRERQLVEAREAAEAATIAKSHFLAQMSHEIRTPMNAIIGTTALARDTPLNKEQAEFIEMIEISAHALLRLVNDILDFSRLEAGQMTMEPLSYDLVETIKDVVDLISPEAAAKRLPVTTQIDPDAPTWLFGDQGRLRQVLVNLVANAIKFTERGEIQIIVAHRPADAKGGIEGLEVAVIDSGIGIGAEARARLFRRFEQGEAGVHRRFGGSGLGLAISAKIIEAMGGQIGVDSVPGLGSRFWFTIPVTRSTETPERRARGGMDRTLQRMESRLRILVAEDNQINQRVIRGLLERLGHSCLTVSNGREAVRTVQTAPFDIVLMDIQMPEMDGIEATRAIRALGYGPAQLPIIAVTANVMPGDAAIYLGVGMNGVLPKPIQPQALIALLASHAVAEPEEADGMPAVETGTEPGDNDLGRIDRDAIVEMREAVGDLAYDGALRDLEADVGRHLEAVASGLALGDANAVRKGAHSLASLLSTFGLVNAGNAFGQVEEALREQDTPRAFALARSLQARAPAMVEKLISVCLEGAQSPGG